jgi:hypothetical protein
MSVAMILEYFPCANELLKITPKPRLSENACGNPIGLIYPDRLVFTSLHRLDILSKYRILLHVSDKLTTQYLFRFCFGKEHPSVYAFYLMTFSSNLSTNYVIEG